MNWDDLLVTRAELGASYARLAAQCDQVFGSGSGWLPVSNRVILEWTRRLGTGGIFSFLSFRMDVKSPAGAVSSTVVCAFTDLPWAMIHGREAYGFPLLLAKFEGDADKTKVTALVVKDSEATEAEVATLAWTPDPSTQSMASTRSKIAMVQLKQVRDAAFPASACFQDLVRAEVRKTTSGSGQSGTLALNLTDYDSLALRADLGLSNPSRAVAERSSGVSLAFAVTSQSRASLTGRGGPPFRFRRGDPQFAPDYEFTNVDIVGFRVPVSPSGLRRICDQFLNDPFPNRGYRYVPADVELIVECLNYPNLRAYNPPPGVWPPDGTQQRELSFRMLVGRVDDGGVVAHSPAVFCPFIFVDNPWSLLSGREVVGYPKALAGFSAIPNEGGQFETCVIESAPEAHDGHVPVPLVTLDCRVDRSHPLAAFLEQGKSTLTPGAAVLDEFDAIEFSWWSLADLQSGRADAESFIGPWLAGQAFGYGLVQRKLIPDACNPERSCFDELTQGEYTMRRVSVSLPVHFASLQFSPDDPFGILRAFGLSPHVIVPPGSWYRVNLDFRVRVLDPLA